MRLIMFALFKNKVKVFFPDIFHLLSNIERGILQRLGSLCPFPIERWNAGDTLHRGCISSLAFLIHLWQHAVFWVSFSPFCPTERILTSSWKVRQNSESWERLRLNPVLPGFSVLYCAVIHWLMQNTYRWYIHWKWYIHRYCVIFTLVEWFPVEWRLTFISNKVRIWICSKDIMAVKYFQVKIWIQD